MKNRVEEILNNFARVTHKVYAKLGEYKKKEKKKAIGFFLTDLPEEIIHAAGMLPIAILGNKDNISLADAYLQTFACSLVRSTLESKLNHTLDTLDGMVIPHICDTTQCLASIWRITFPNEYFDDLVFPKRRDQESARAYLINELKRFKHGLEDYFQLKITEQNLWKSIQIYNQNRQLLRELYALKRTYPQALHEQEFFTIIKASMLMPKEEHNRLLSELMEDLKKRQVRPEKRIKLVVSGMVPEPSQALGLIDELGGTIVDDDFCIGSRYFAEDIHINHDPIEAIADRHLRRTPFSGYHIIGEEMGDSLLERVEHTGAQGVIFWHLKFCEVYNFDYPDQKKRLEEKNIPHLLLETELQMTSLEQLRTRLQAFMEMLGRK
jgi:bcr-type benzoyl-CoA reductase subunit C